MRWSAQPSCWILSWGSRWEAGRIELVASAPSFPGLEKSRFFWGLCFHRQEEPLLLASWSSPEGPGLDERPCGLKSDVCRGQVVMSPLGLKEPAWWVPSLLPHSANVYLALAMRRCCSRCWGNSGDPSPGGTRILGRQVDNTLRKVSEHCSGM